MSRSMLEKWREQLSQLSNNLTTNEVMPSFIVEKILEEDISLNDKLAFEEINFPKLLPPLDKINGLHILAGLQNMTKPGSLTLFRAVRFPTYKRMFEVMSHSGYAISNYEQERILNLYQKPEYIERRREIQ